MTNAESYLKAATEKLHAGRLKPFASQFILDIAGYDKKQLRKLSSKQFKFLRDIANECIFDL